MEIQEGLRIMRALADGVSPDTGELLTGDAVYQYAPVVRALHRAVGKVEYLAERRFQKDAAGKPGEIVVSGRR